MLHVIQSLPEQGGDMIVVQTVENLSPLFARADEAHLPQPAHVMRDSRFTNANCLSQRADVHFTVCQRRDEAHTAGVAEGAK